MEVIIVPDDYLRDALDSSMSDYLTMAAAL